MTDSDHTPGNGSTNAERTGFETNDALAEHIRTLANRLNTDLHDLASSIERGDDVDGVKKARANLLEADRTVRRHVGGVTEPDLDDVERDPRNRDMADFTDVYNVEYLRTAPADEVAAKLAADMMETREISDRVDRHLHTGELSDLDVQDLWEYGLRLRGWSTQVLSHRTDRRVLFSRAEAEALEDVDEDRVVEEDRHA